MAILLDKPIDKGTTPPQRFLALKEALASKYGQPAEWDEPITLIAHWNNDTTTVQLKHTEIPNRVTIVYWATAMEGEVEKVNTDNL